MNATKEMQKLREAVPDTGNQTGCVQPSMSSGTARAWFSLEEALREAIEQGKETEFTSLIRFLPEHKREHYREVWKSARATRKA